METSASLIMDAPRIERSLVRMAWQIYENHHDHQDLVMAGICGRGEDLMNRLADKLEQISTLNINRVVVHLDKRQPWQSEVKYEGLDLNTLSSTAVVLIDDVLNSGKTLTYAAAPLLKFEISKLTVTVLVDRSHKRFPILANVVGLKLSTSSHEHVRVELSDVERVYLV
jgi:pyrimidine operon attenuation protein/uracil phosphoribosyltransferase